MIQGVVLGTPETLRVLRQLPGKVQRKVIRQSAIAGSRVIAKEARARAPVDSGKLKKSITVKAKNRNGQIESFVFASRRKGAYHRHFIELGTKSHVINLRSARAGQGKKKTLSDGRTAFGARVNHPGTPARPFLGAALSAKEAEARRKFEQVFFRNLERETVRLAGPLTTRQRQNFFRN